jgi:hypothetical protein
MVNTNPSISSHTIDLFTDGVVGTIYKFKIRAINSAGYLDSSSLSVALSSLPEKPGVPPISDDSITDQTRLGIDITAFDSTNNGGTPILIYNI